MSTVDVDVPCDHDETVPSPLRNRDGYVKVARRTAMDFVSGGWMDGRLIFSKL